MKKKSFKIVLGTVMLSAIMACNSQEPVSDNWIKGDVNGKTKDTVINNKHYRQHGVMWFPIVNGMISPSSYRGGSISEISSPSYTPSRITSTSSSSSRRSGGFGSSSHPVVG